VRDGGRIISVAAIVAVAVNTEGRCEIVGLPLVLDGEIAVPDERGVTHIDLLSEALRQRRPESLAYFAFDLPPRRPRSARLRDRGSQGTAA
jgi:hypothetical protein